VSCHPQVQLVPPEGDDDDPVGIDAELVPLIQALWAAGYTTITCCQDLGESIRDSNRRKSAYWKGWVLLELPATDAKALAELAASFGGFPMHWADDDAWDITMPLLMLGPNAVLPGIVQVHFPFIQLGRLTDVVRSRGAQFRAGR